MKKMLSLSALGLMALCSAPITASAQAPAPAPDPNAPPQVLVITREEVKPGRGAAHVANEVGWAAMMAKAQWSTGWLGATSLTGPSEAWFFTGFASLAEFDKDRVAQEAAPALSDTAKFQAIDGDLVNRTSTLIAAYRPLLSYQPDVNLAKMRYFSVDTVVVKPGQAAPFAAQWREIIEAHSKAKLDEHWAVYEVTSGGQTGTYMFIYALDSLATLDASGAKHVASAYRDAMGEAGRAANTRMNQDAIEWQQNRLFAFSPKMSHLTKAWTDVDPDFWMPRPAPVAIAKKK
jgi:hypothetical protein